MAQGFLLSLEEQLFQIKASLTSIAVLGVIWLHYESLGVAVGKHQVRQVQ